MATKKPCNLSSDSLPLSVDFIDLTIESPVHRFSQTSGNSTVRSQLRLDSKPESFLLHKDISDTLDAAVTLTTRVAPTTCRNSTSETRSGTRRVISNAKVRSKVATSNKSKSNSKNKFKSEAKPDEIINLDDTVLPELSSPSCTNNSTLICAICLEELLSQRKPIATHCGHIFCEECLHRAMRKVKLCPKCRRGITKKTCIRLHF